MGQDCLFITFSPKVNPFTGRHNPIINITQTCCQSWERETAGESRMNIYRDFPSPLLMSPQPRGSQVKYPSDSGLAQGEIEGGRNCLWHWKDMEQVFSYLFSQYRKTAFVCSYIIIHACSIFELVEVRQDIKLTGTTCKPMNLVLDWVSGMAQLPPLTSYHHLRLFISVFDNVLLTLGGLPMFFLLWFRSCGLHWLVVVDLTDNPESQFPFPFLDLTL